MNKYILTAIIMLILDSIYLTLTKNYYSNLILKIQKSPININYPAMIGCYLLLIIGINYFIIKENKSILEAFLLGIVIYGVFDLTNKAIINDWDYQTVIMDSLWGGILFALTTFIIKKIN